MTRRRSGIPEPRPRAIASAVVLLAITAVLVIQYHALSTSVVRDRTIGRKPDGEPAWIVDVRRAETALEHGDVIAAERAWRDARMEAAETPDWRAMIEVGDAAVRIAGASGERGSLASQARRAYLAAFFRARGLHSREGMLRAADGFAALGDREIAEQCRRAAER